MQEALNPFLKLDVSAEIAEFLDHALDDRADGIFFLNHRPWIRLGLLHSERDALFLDVNIQDDHINLIAFLDEV